MGSGPFVLESSRRASSPASRRTSTTGAAAVDTVVLRKFNNPDAMVAALKTGELDAAEDIPGGAFNQLKNDADFETIEGNQGAMSEIAINGGDGLKKPHPALLDPKVRKAIAHAIDKKTIVAGCWTGSASPPRPSARPPTRSGCRRSPRTSVFDFDLDEGQADPRGRRLQGHGRRRRARDARRRSRSSSSTCPLRRRDRARRSPSSSPAGSRRSGSPRPRRSPSDSRAHADHRQGRLRHVRVGLDPVRGPGHDARRTSGATRSRATPPTRPTTTTTRTTATPSTTSSTSSRRSSSIRRSGWTSCTRCSPASSSGAPTTCSTPIRTRRRT